MVAASDYVKALPQLIASYTPAGLHALGTDGFGRSEGRGALRSHFEVDAAHIVFSTLGALAEDGRFPREKLKQAAKALGIGVRTLSGKLRQYGYAPRAKIASTATAAREKETV